MSASLAVLIPFALLAVVALLCFVGCGLPTTGSKQITDWQQYENTVTGTSNLVAYWPLNETTGTTANDLGPNNFPGTYTVGPNVPYDAADQSAAAPGTFTLGQPNIVAGDTVNNDQTTPSTSVLFDGGYVSVPFQAALNPAAPFTVEAWAVPLWTFDATQKAVRSVVVSAGASPLQGFSLFATADNYWAAFLGLGGSSTIVTQPTGSNQTIASGQSYYLVVTYDGTTLTLWVNPAETTPGSEYAKGPASGFAPTVSPIPLYIGMGRPDRATPLFPFNGRIQDVAFYNAVLDGNTIQTHYLNGSGMQDP